MILMIDNYDSFTYNLVQYLGELGANLVVHRNDKITLDQIESLAPEKIVISPGPCTPREAGISCDLIRHFAGRVPLLGVCLGSSVHRRCLWWRCCPRWTVDARQNVNDSPQW